MSTEHKQLIREMYAAYSRDDIDSVLNYMAPDIVWYSPGAAPFAGHRSGREEMRRFFEDVRRWVRIDQFDLDDVLADGDKVVALGRQRATVRETGASYDTHWAHLYTVRGGKVASGEVFADTHAIASAFGESTRERQALTGPLGVTQPAFSGGE
jgi:hypothetical protein